MIDEANRVDADARRAASVRARAVVIAGPPASGKTTLGAALARALHHALIDLDIVTGPLTSAALALAGADETALDGELGAQLRDARYGTLLDTAEANLRAGIGVVLTGPFTRERSDPASWEALRARLGGAETCLICLELDERHRRARMRARGAVRDQRKLTAALEPRPPQARLPQGAIPLDAAVGRRMLLDSALAALSRC